MSAIPCIKRQKLVEEGRKYNINIPVEHNKSLFQWLRPVRKVIQD